MIEIVNKWNGVVIVMVRMSESRRFDEKINRRKNMCKKGGVVVEKKKMGKHILSKMCFRDVHQHFHQAETPPDVVHPTIQTIEIFWKPVRGHELSKKAL